MGSLPFTVLFDAGAAALYMQIVNRVDSRYKPRLVRLNDRK